MVEPKFEMMDPLEARNAVMEFHATVNTGLKTLAQDVLTRLTGTIAEHTIDLEPSTTAGAVSGGGGAEITTADEHSFPARENELELVKAALVKSGKKDAAVTEILEKTQTLVQGYIYKTGEDITSDPNPYA